MFSQYLNILNSHLKKKEAYFLDIISHLNVQVLKKKFH